MRIARVAAVLLALLAAFALGRYGRECLVDPVPGAAAVTDTTPDTGTESAPVPVPDVNDDDDDDADTGTDTDDLVLVGIVDRIVDGDTLDVVLDSGKIRVRVWGIDTPERGQPLFDEAAAQLRQLAPEGSKVELQPANQTTWDRMVARVLVDGTDVDAEVLKRGFAMAERRYLNQFPDGKDYCMFEQSARSSKLGIWLLPADQRPAPWEWRGRKKRTKPFTDYGKGTVANCVAAIGKPLSD